MRLLCTAALVYKNTDKKQQKHNFALYAAYSNDTTTLYHTKAPKPTAQTKKTRHDSFYKHKRHSQTTTPTSRTRSIHIHIHLSQLYIIHKSSHSASIVAYKFANEIKQKLNKKTGQTEHLPRSKYKL